MAKATVVTKKTAKTVAPITVAPRPDESFIGPMPQVESKPSPVAVPIQSVVEIMLDNIREEEGWNTRQKTIISGSTSVSGSLRLDLIVPQIVARGGVITPITVYYEDGWYIPVSGHRRVGGCRVIKGIKAETITEDIAYHEYNINKEEFKNVKDTSCVYSSLPAIVIPKGNELSRRLDSLTSNSAVPLAPIEKAKELLKLTKCTWRDVLEARPSMALPGSKALDDKLSDADVSRLVGISKTYTSNLLDMVRPKEGMTQAMLDARDFLLVELDAKRIHQSIFNTVLPAKPETIAAAQELIDRARASAKAKEAGQSTAGQSTAGQSTAGQSTAGQTTAGQSTAGQSTAGQSTAGQSTAGQSTAGQSTAGQSTASAPLVPEKSKEEQAKQEKLDDGNALLHILERRGIPWALNAIERWAFNQKPKVQLPWASNATPFIPVNAPQVAAPAIGNKARK